MSKTAETPRPQGPQRVEDAPPWPHHWCVAKYNGDFFLSRSDADLAYYRDLSQWYDAQLAQSQAALSASEAALAEARELIQAAKDNAGVCRLGQTLENSIDAFLARTAPAAGEKP